MRTAEEIYNEQIQCLDKVISLLEDNLKKDDIDYEEVSDEMWDILNEFVLTWEENTNQDAFELYDNILKIVETEFNVMIS